MERTCGLAASWKVRVSVSVPPLSPCPLALRIGFFPEGLLHVVAQERHASPPQESQQKGRLLVIRFSKGPERVPLTVQLRCPV